MFRRFLFRLASFGKTVSRSFMKILSELYLLLFYFVHWKSSSLCRGGSPRYKVHKIWLTVARLIGLSLVLYPLWAELLHLVCIYTRIRMCHLNFLMIFGITVVTLGNFCYEQNCSFWEALWTKKRRNIPNIQLSTF